MVRTDQMWRYTRTVELGHYHESDDKALTWTKLTAVAPSEAQGWDFELEDGCKLQSCFATTEIDVRTIWHEDVLNWGKVPDPSGQVVAALTYAYGPVGGDVDTWAQQVAAAGTYAPGATDEDDNAAVRALQRDRTNAIA